MRHAEKFHLVIRRGAASDPDSATDVAIIDEPAVLGTLMELLARRFGAPLLRERPKPTLLPVKRPIRAPSSGDDGEQR